MTNERKVIREELKKRKAKGRPIPSGNDSESDIEFVDKDSPRPQKRRCLGAGMPARQRPQLHISIPTPTPSRVTTSISPSPLSSSLSDAPFFSPSTLQARWPRKWHAVDIVAGFDQLDDLCELDAQQRVPINLTSHLFTVYGCDIPASTYRDARNRWDKASQSLRNQVLDGGRTDSGLWTYLLSRVPLKG
jgi:hypothetical protein